jgi:thiol-disulfide isomerase/thioredoxin
MKTIFKVCLILIAVSHLNCTQTINNANNFNLEGKVIGRDTGQIILNYGFGIKFHADTTQIKNGKFVFQGTIEEPTRATIIGGNDSNTVEIYIEPGKLNATLYNDKFKNIDLSGSNAQKELDILNKSLELTNNKDSVLLNFVSKHPNSYLTPYYLCVLNLSPDTINKIYSGLNVNIQKSRFGKMVLGHIRQNLNTTIGEIASDFNAIDVNGDSISLAQFKGKNIVLMEFWASWCVPCREGIPHLKLLYKKYHSNGLEIIAVASADKSRESWEAAINQDSTKIWHHVGTFFRDGLTINEQIALEYPWAPIPRTILIDINSKVLGSWQGRSTENTESLDMELKRIFGN